MPFGVVVGVSCFPSRFWAPRGVKIPTPGLGNQQELAIQPGTDGGEVPSVRTARHRPSSRHCLAQNTHLRDQNSVSSEKLDTRPPMGRAETGGIEPSGGPLPAARARPALAVEGARPPGVNGEGFCGLAGGRLENQPQFDPQRP